MKYFVISTVRRVQTRVNRMRSASRHRFKQIICGGRLRLVRKRPVPLPVDLLVDHYDELCKAQRDGVLEVHEESPLGAVHHFSEELLAWKEQCKVLQAEHVLRQAKLRQEGKGKEAKELEFVLPVPPTEWRGVQESEPVPDPVLSDDDSEELDEAPEEEDLEEEPEVEPEEEPEKAESYEPDKSVDRMNKMELIAHACRITGQDPVDFDDMTKREILEQLP